MGGDGRGAEGRGEARARPGGGDARARGRALRARNCCSVAARRLWRSRACPRGTLAQVSAPTPPRSCGAASRRAGGRGGGRGSRALGLGRGLALPSAPLPSSGSMGPPLAGLEPCAAQPGRLRKWSCRLRAGDVSLHFGRAASVWRDVGWGGLAVGDPSRALQLRDSPDPPTPLPRSAPSASWTASRGLGGPCGSGSRTGAAGGGRGRGLAEVTPSRGSGGPRPPRVAAGSLGRLSRAGRARAPSPGVSAQPAGRAPTEAQFRVFFPPLSQLEGF